MRHKRLVIALSSASRSSAQGIARTRDPDQETVLCLGLDPDSLFRKSAAVKEKPQ
jgi:hypothetical protein